MRLCNQAGIDIIKQFEGCKLHAYRDMGGVWTIGYGHTGTTAEPNRVIPQSYANALLIGDVNNVAIQLDKVLPTTLNENQFSACCSLAFNIGVHALLNSTLATILSTTKPSAAADEFLKWNHVNGKVVEGLTARRAAEKQLFLMRVT